MRIPCALMLASILVLSCATPRKSHPDPVPGVLPEASGERVAGETARDEREMVVAGGTMRDERERVVATGWVGFELSEPHAYDRLPGAEKHHVRDRFWMELIAAGLGCPSPHPIETLLLEEHPKLGVTNAEMMRKLDAALRTLGTGLSALRPKRVEYECVDGNPKCKHPFLLQRNGVPFVSCQETSLGPIHASFDITVVWDSR